ncbi:thiamine pyrophosphate-binding protein [Rhizorhabdus dicambivorans]|uniref:Thiamine pyrophosphate-binding protein n=1 Tax=Rhizorhabdus dicambivorans TaxID=1850238 RepID=A0A2A4FSK6_9SPHN|nr:thiamine pyrophosphate-binding protein [Rhizorhabdus dicambivorans]ATE63827.1 thiamine pyrophosphate-binding protein [Rhizorhabdus dicambivorans]PCE40662.1 thiamine pyrophosphate-binding protein [Rhizorhabdus dicambivorans]
MHDMTRTSPATVASRLAEALVAQGVDHVFCVPGESYLAVLDALYDLRREIRLITCRNEIAAANMAEAYGKLTGRPGICMVTRGPGASHAAVGVHTAEQDSTPMILFVGQIERGHRGRGAFQEVDYRQMFGSIAKWTAELEEADRVDEIVRRAFSTALNGRRGPVVLSLPEDVLTEPAVGTALPWRAGPVRSGLEPGVLAAIGDRLRAASKPLLILGGSGWSREAAGRLADWAEGMDLPIALSFRRKDLIDNRRPCYIGDFGLGINPRLVARLAEADLVIALGARLGDNPTGGYSFLDPAVTAERLVHIHPDPEELGRVWPAAIAAVADPDAAAIGLASLDGDRRWTAWRAEARADWEAFTQPVPTAGPVNLSELFGEMRAALPDDAIVTNGAGNYAAWLHRFFPCHGFGTQLAPTSGAMGYGFPAAIAAKSIHPSREVVSVAGDGCFMMVAQELATVVQHDIPMIVVLIDNGSYGTIRMHQERNFPGRTVATDLVNPDFGALARSFGIASWRVEKTADFGPAFAEARASGRPALIHVLTSINDIAPGRRIETTAASTI